jgi:hypothetical protein
MSYVRTPGSFAGSGFLDTLAEKLVSRAESAITRIGPGMAGVISTIGRLTARQQRNADFL